jgi:hypothetical protein
MPVSSSQYERSVFINCPFDSHYKPLFDAIVFAVQIAGFKPRSAREITDSGAIRIQRIMDIIAECQYGVHDISRTELGSNRLPRFNMPLELGIDLGSRRFGTPRHQTKRLLVMDTKQYRYQRFISDINGQDIRPHSRSIKQVVNNIRDWLSESSGIDTMPGGDYMYWRYRAFQRELPGLCKQWKRNLNRLTFGDLTHIARIWLEENEQ